MHLSRISLYWTRLLLSFVVVAAIVPIVPALADGGNVYKPHAGRHVSASEDLRSVEAPATSEHAIDNRSLPATPSATQSGFVIHATFDSSITGNSNAAAIEAAINQSIALYESLFTDPITVEIYFRYSPNQPDGTPFPTGAVAQSNYVIYDVPWSTYISSLLADSRTSNDATAYSSLPITTLTPNISPSGPGGRAIGLYTPPSMFANGNIADGGPYDGIVSLNSKSPYQFTRPPGSGNYDAQTGIEHEMDEILGLGSYLNGLPKYTDLRPQDLFSWSAPGTRNHSTTGIRYFSINNGNTIIVNFSQDPMGDFGDWLSASCPQLHPYVQNAFGCPGQYSDVTATSPEGINLDVVGYDLAPALLPPGASVLANISTRGLVETGDEVLIGGFIVTGTTPKEVIVRAIGPSLPLTGVLADPVLELHDATSALIASNDNWRTDDEAEILATGVAPTNDAESAIVATLNPGSYTAVVSGANGGTGVGLVEVYDLDQTVDSKLANISTRGFVGTDNNVLIGGFIVLGNNAAGTIVRAIGPSLTSQNVADPLQDPELELHDSYGTLIASNDDWRSDQQSAILATDIAPTDDAESAIVQTLGPGAYTVIVSGKNDTTGVALVEVYGL